MDTVKAILKYLTLFIVTLAVLISLFLLVAQIPREKIQNNMEKSAEYMQQKGAAFPFTVLGIGCSKADYYADTVLLNVAYYLEPRHSAESISWARFYSEDAYDWNGMVTDYFPTAIAKKPEPNQQYLRYWHGSLTIVRPLLIWLSVSDIYKILGVVLWILLVSIIILLIRRDLKKEAVAFALAMIGVSVWFVPVCLEYIWMFLLMAITSLIAIRISLKERYKTMPAVFLCVGMVAAFLDFFTTETITLLIPLLFMYAIHHRQSNKAPNQIFALKCAVLWGTGYIAMWISKWAFAADVLKRDVMPFIRSSITEHLGAADNISLVQLWGKSIHNNIYKLFTFDYGMIGAILTLLLLFGFVFLPVGFNKIKLKEKIQKEWVLLYLIAGLVPYLRFVIISEHSAVHAWFTYRAQAASIMALTLVFFELVDIRIDHKRKEKYGKKK